MTGQPTVTISAPAKLNLGLEILGKRDDGYHDIRSVMAMIDLADTLRLSPTDGKEGVMIAGVPGIAVEDNLITKAVTAFTKATGFHAGYTISIEKRIPSPGGLGGASSDASATLRALNALHNSPLSSAELLRIAGELGSDVPFFLGSPVALASGTGTTLAPLPNVDGWAVIVVPTFALAAKTPTLYRSLRPGDFSDGSRADSVADGIAHGRLPSAKDLTNAFTRPLYALAPELKVIPETMTEVGAPHVALSGAGPAHYVLTPTEDHARAVASRLTDSLAPGVTVGVTRLLHERPSPVVERR